MRPKIYGPVKKFEYGNVPDNIEEIKKKENRFRRPKPKNYLEKLMIKGERKEIYLKEREKEKNRTIKRPRRHKIYWKNTTTKIIFSQKIQKQ